jgi:hypothetical protein
MYIGTPEPMPAKEHDEGPFSNGRRIQIAKRNISPVLIASLEIEPWRARSGPDEVANVNLGNDLCRSWIAMNVNAGTLMGFMTNDSVYKT